MPRLRSPMATLSRYIGLMKALDKQDEPTATDRWAWSNEVEQGKFTLNIINELYKTASPAAREGYKDLLRNIESGLTPMQRAAAQAIIQHSPLNPIQERMDQWDKTHTRPKVTAKLNEDPFLVAAQVQAVTRYDALRESFRTGKPPVFPKLTGIGNGLFQIEDEHGRPSIASSEELGLEAIAEKNDTTPAKLIAQQGWIYKTPVEFGSNGQLYKVRERFNALDPTVGVQKEISPSAGTIVDRRVEDKAWTGFVAAFAGDDKDNKIYKGYKSLAEEDTSEAELRAYLNTAFPNRRFKYIAKRNQPVYWWNSWTETPKEFEHLGKYFVSWPATTQAKVGDGWVDYDEPSQTYYDKDGRPWRSLEEIEAALEKVRNK